MNCNLCPSASNFNPGLKGKNADKTKFLFVLNHSDNRVRTYLNFSNQIYEMALRTSHTGEVLDDILRHCNLKFDDVFVTNMFKCLLPEGREPTSAEYVNCLSVFDAQISEFNPRAMVLFGSNAYKYLFSEESRREPLKKAVGKTLSYRKIPSLISYHPSKLWALLSPERRKPHYEAARQFLDSFRQQ